LQKNRRTAPLDVLTSGCDKMALRDVLTRRCVQTALPKALDITLEWGVFQLRTRFA
jgi:hypothetical protein